MSPVFGPTTGGDEVGGPVRPALLSAAPASPGEGRAFAYSLLLPGSGQHALGQRRWMAYAAVELGAAVMYLDRRWSGHDLRDRYRELAWSAARDGRGPAVVDDFEYYERLITWTSSGAWDRDVDAPGLQPETDPATYNGSIWQQAQDLFFGPDPASVRPGDPAWEQALQYYQTRAYGPEFLWDWSDDPEARERYADLLDDSDDDLRTATTMLGILLANHLVSAADAFLSARARAASGDRVDLRLRLDRTRAGARLGTDGRAATTPPGEPLDLLPTRLTLALAVRP